MVFIFMNVPFDGAIDLLYNWWSVK